MAFWNAPVEVADHPLRACRAALAMRATVDDLNARDAFGFAARGRGDLQVRIGIGINTGDACVGNMGSERRFNYSVVGDAVNVASRIEANCKDMGVDILISESTARAVPDLATLEAGEVMLKGKSRVLKLFALIGDEALAATSEFRELVRLHADLVAGAKEPDRAGAHAALEACRALAGPRLRSLLQSQRGEAPEEGGGPCRGERMIRACLAVKGPSIPAHGGGLNRIQKDEQTGVWRPRPESNRGARICSPLRNHSATRPIEQRPPRAAAFP